MKMLRNQFYRDTIPRYLEKLDSTESGSGTASKTGSLNAVRADVAIVDARYEIGDRKMWSTFIMKRGPGGWRIQAIRNMMPTAQSTPPPDPAAAHALLPASGLTR